MSQLTNDALLEQLVELGVNLGDEIYLFAGAPTTQAGGGPVKAALHRIVVNNQAGAALVMKSILSNDAPSFVWLINDGVQAVSVFPFKQPTGTQESMLGVANASFSVTAGNAAVFMSIPVLIKRKGSSSGGTVDWRASLIS